MDNNSNKNKFYPNNSSSKFQGNQDHIHVDFIPELTQYQSNSIPSKQKSASNTNFKQQLINKGMKPQGNIVIQ